MSSIVLNQLDRFGPDRCEPLTYEQATAYTQRLVREQYENFSVTSRLLPKPLRVPFAHIYAFCRWADDLGDETGDTRRSLELLGWWRQELDLCYDGRPRHPVFVALRRTIEQHRIPRQPFDDLIDAFEQDQRVTRYQTWEQVLDYCTRSANPVGRLVLYVCGYDDEQRQRLSDATCTALQLINFWQDVRRDILERDRVYIPEQVARAHGLDVERMVSAVRHEVKREPACSGCVPAAPGPGLRAVQPALRATVRELVERTEPMFGQGRQLWPLLGRDVRPSIELFTRGGEAILRKIRNQDYDTLVRRPRLSAWGKAALVGGTLARRYWNPGEWGRANGHDADKRRHTSTACDGPG